MLERRTRDRKFAGSILDIHSRMRLECSDSARKQTMALSAIKNIKNKK